MKRGTFNIVIGLVMGILSVMAFMQAQGIDGALFMSMLLLQIGYDNFMQGFYERYSYEEVNPNEV